MRKKTPQNTIQQVDNDSNDHVDSIESYSDSSSNISNSSFSDISSEECDYNKKLKSSPINRAKRKQYKCMQCGSVKTRRRFGNNEIFQNHLKLHSEGQYQCNFCSKVEPSLVMLSSHEYKTHGVGENQAAKKRNGWTCPRCPFKAIYLTDYESHFAYTHFTVA